MSVRHYQDITGQRFGRLLAIRHIGQSQWLCRCDCGGSSTPKLVHLRRGNSVSCGCVRRELLFTHGMSRTTIYRCWAGMVSRCGNPNDPNYPNYGGRGIRVCDRWAEFVNFLADMGNRSKGYDLDRIDNSKGYEPGNCRWVTRKVNLRNTRRNVMITHNGETRAQSEWAEITGISEKTLRYRISAGWSMDEVFDANRRLRSGRKSP